MAPGANSSNLRFVGYGSEVMGNGPSPPCNLLPMTYYLWRRYALCVGCDLCGLSGSDVL